MPIWRYMVLVVRPKGVPDMDSSGSSVSSQCQSSCIILHGHTHLKLNLWLASLWDLKAFSVKAVLITQLGRWLPHFVVLFYSIAVQLTRLLFGDKEAWVTGLISALRNSTVFFFKGRLEFDLAHTTNISPLAFIAEAAENVITSWGLMNVLNLLITNCLFLSNRNIYTHIDIIYQTKAVKIFVCLKHLLWESA